VDAVSVLDVPKGIAVQADDQLVEQAFGIGGLTILRIDDAANLSLLGIASRDLWQPCFVEIFFIGSFIGDELGDETDRVRVVIWGQTSYTVGKIEAFHQAEKDRVESRFVTRIRWTSRIIP